MVFFFLAWFVVLLFCRLLWSGLGELVSMMEHDLGCSMSIVNHDFGGGLV
jgi:hypothetical protein